MGKIGERLQKEGLGHREAGKRLGYERRQIGESFKRLYRKEPLGVAGILLKYKARPMFLIQIPRGYSLQNQEHVYVIHPEAVACPLSLEQRRCRRGGFIGFERVGEKSRSKLLQILLLSAFISVLEGRLFGCAAIAIVSFDLPFR